MTIFERILIERKTMVIGKQENSYAQKKKHILGIVSQNIQILLKRIINLGNLY